MELEKGLKIWEARMNLSMTADEEYQVNFYFEPEKGEYKKGKTDYWESGKAWVANSIPINLTVKRLYSTYTAIQGFERPLSSEELEQLKAEMRASLIQHIEREKQEFMHYHDCKIKAIFDFK